MSHFSTKYVHLILIVFISLVSLRYLFLDPLMMQTVDGEYHLGRFGNFRQALIQGQFPPRWGPSLNYGYGYPVFNFNYPLPNIMAVLIHPLVGSYVNSFKAMVVISFISAGVACYVLFYQQSKTAGLLAATVYLIAPYSLLNVFERGSIGEILAFGLLPWLLYWVQKQALSPSKIHFVALTSCLSLFWISHNLTAVFGTGLLILYLVVFHRQQLKHLIWPSLLAGLLVAWFWLPALNEITYTNLAHASLNTDYYLFFKDFRSLLQIPPDNTYALTAAGVPIKQQVGYAPLAVFGLSLWVLFRSRTKTHHKLFFWTLIFGLAVFATNQASEFLWRMIPPARYMQFPFRSIFYSTFAAALMSGYVARHKPKISLVILVSLAVLNMQFFYKPKYWIDYQDDILEKYPLTTTAENELDPPWFDSYTIQNSFDYNPDFPLILPDQKVDVTFEKLTGSHKIYQIKTSEPVPIIEQTLYFPGWETSIDGHPIDIAASKHNFYGLINYQVDAGQHRIETKFTQNTPARWWGNSLFFVGLIGIMVRIIKS